MMDETDIKILKKLLADARSSYRKIAFEIGVSPPTVLNRISKLEKNEYNKILFSSNGSCKVGI